MKVSREVNSGEDQMIFAVHIANDIKPFQALIDSKQLQLLVKPLN